MVKPAKGTTTLAFIFKEGVMVAADSRASMGGYICMLFLFSILHIIIYGFWMLILYISISLQKLDFLLMIMLMNVFTHKHAHSQLGVINFPLLVNWNSMYEFLFEIIDQLMLQVTLILNRSVQLHCLKWMCNVMLHLLFPSLSYQHHSL